MVTSQSLFNMVENTLLPGDPLPFNSHFYIERPPLESDAYQEISKPGGLLRIRASYNMGKSSLISRLIHQLINQGYSIVTIDFKQADRQVFTSINKFLRWFCVNVSRQLSLIPNINHYWDDDIGSKISASIYFEYYILEMVEQPICLVLNELQYVFEYPQIAQDFLPLLRSWYEQAKQNKIWQKLRLSLVYSTEIYVPLNVNQSPFNVGLSLKLPEFNIEQVTEFAQRYELKGINNINIQELMNLVGGHPYLIHLSFYHLQKQTISFQELLQTAISYDGIYSNHLRYLLNYLQINPELLQAYYQLIISQSQDYISAQIIHKLDSLGLIKKAEDNTFKPACEMYRLFFNQEKLITSDHQSLRIKQLEAENEKLKFLVNIDALTQVANRRYFDDRFQLEWRRMERTQQPIALILSDVDRFKLFNDTYGHQAGDECLRQVAQMINSVIKRPGDLVARYGGEEFALILPQTDAQGALLIAEEIRRKIKKSQIKILRFSHNNQAPDQMNVTISLGVAAIIPQKSLVLEQLLAAADQALYQAKQTGRDRSILSLDFRYCQLIN